MSFKPGSTTTSEEITGYCRELLAADKYQREVHVLPELPEGATGKILNRDLRSDH